MQSECLHRYVEKLDIGICCLSCGSIRNSTYESTAVASEQPADEEYRYQRLDHNLKHIRLVELLPVRGLDPISCRIKIAQLQHLPPYAAISYTWATEGGDASRVRKIYVDVGRFLKTVRIFRVTINCEEILQQIRSQHSSRTIWIDAIYIDQDFISERNRQVRLMDQIYERASNVEICIQVQGQDYQDVS
ncbi:hypothetical protein EK21DRAFT_54070 [Setomelanomma holmii]|uniref:Heterokaryon incompatibility domain-containing protein n=1 Tax=Setomelanomma holmii TaxID=210430 RepID=A0A9P4HJ58_9PLEO|nr:hypothetical protein EK21DRAFT_54070 [Setomelanomma holmii]